MDTPISNATPGLPVDNKLPAATTPCQWNDSRTPFYKAENPGRTLYMQYEHDFFTPYLHQTQGRADNPMQSLTAQYCLYTATAVNIHHFFLIRVTTS